MRLLEILPNGDFCLTKNLLNKAIPQYAILSHRWENDEQEVTFEDMDKGSGQGKAGYMKIEFCGEQAAKDGLRHFWVDSCCIKKSDSSELTESLNSMFRWYSRAKTCYVYLSDVSTTRRERRKRREGRLKNLPDSWEQAFRASEWFTRGWTLQELLAPNSVEFFSRDGERLGNKQSLEQQICEITGIPISALQGTSLSHFSAKQKFDWAEDRKTTREEDWAYSLLGIFGIFMPIIYGEGRESAVNRLKKEIDEAPKDNVSKDKESRDKKLKDTTPEPFSTVPFAPDHDFVDRPEIRVWIRDKCARPGSRAALVGLGGVGYVNVPWSLRARL